MHEVRAPQRGAVLRCSLCLPLIVLAMLAAGSDFVPLDVVAALDPGQPPDAPVAPDRSWYVATQGEDTKGNGSISSPFRTIQRAIDAARDGDTVVVLEGRYTGPGNTNLDFLGKAIMVQSRDPDDEACLRATVLDAEGRGTLVRFVHDEGPLSALAGFTLLAGDTSLPVRGVPGFFEFSPGARPTTRQLAVAGEGGPVPERQTRPAGAQPPSGERLWDGNDPFHQPFATTDYYGSGDADRDGALTAADVTLAQQMAGFQKDPSTTADVDGDGAVTMADAARIDGALGGGPLPGWWDRLTDRVQRSCWVTKILAQDPTDQHPYRPKWFVCLDFAAQLFLHAAGCRADLFFTHWTGGQTWFNIPFYAVSVTAPGYGHAINAVLVGDDPLNFYDWRFIEPQTDGDATPGAWDMPTGSTVEIVTYDLVRGDYGIPTASKVTFFVEYPGWTLKEHDPDLILTRPDPPVRTVDNRPDLWNPRIVPAGAGYLLYDRLRDSFFRMTTIHLAELPVADPPDDFPLARLSQYERLLDLYADPDGVPHLLWKGDPEYIPGVFYGTLDAAEADISNVTRISTEPHIVRMARLRTTPDGAMHAFWFERDLATGIFWAQKTEAGWSTPQNLSPNMDYGSQFDHWLTWDNRDLLRYFFDVTVAGDGKIWLVWSEQVPDPGDSEIHQRIYDGTWGAETVLEAGDSRGVDLFTDAGGSPHLLSWHRPRHSEDRGELRHRAHDSTGW